MKKIKSICQRNTSETVRSQTRIVPFMSDDGYGHENIEHSCFERRVETTNEKVKFEKVEDLNNSENFDIRSVYSRLSTIPSVSMEMESSSEVLNEGSVEWSDYKTDVMTNRWTRHSDLPKFCHGYVAVIVVIALVVFVLMIILL